MRKVTFLKSASVFKKLMIHTSSDKAYLFLYDSVDDRPCIADLTFNTIEEADTYCRNMYHTATDDWIPISDPLTDCQDDYILPTRIKGREPGDPKWGPFQYQNEKWIDISPPEKYLSFEGMNKTLCLLVSGLLNEFEHAKRADRAKAIKILANLGLPIDACFLHSTR